MSQLAIQECVEYSLTPVGKSLIPHIGALITWSLENYPSAVKE